MPLVIHDEIDSDNDDEDPIDRRRPKSRRATRATGGSSCVSSGWILGSALLCVSVVGVASGVLLDRRLSRLEAQLGDCDCVNVEALERKMVNTTSQLEAFRAEVQEELASVMTNEELAAMVHKSVETTQHDLNETETRLSRAMTTQLKNTHDEVVDETSRSTEAALSESTRLYNTKLERFATKQTRRENDLDSSVKKVVGLIENTTEGHMFDLEKAANATSHLVAADAERTKVRTVLALQTAASKANSTVEAARMSLERTAARSESSVVELNRTVEAALERIDHREAEFDAALAAAEADLAVSASSIESRLDDSTSRLVELEDSVLDYESDTRKRFDKQSALLRSWIAGFFAMMAALITFRHVYSHTTRMAFPEAQRKVLAILWMVPIYAISSWAAIVWPRAALEVQLISSIYEAYTVYMFFALLVAMLSDGQGEEEAIATLPPRMRSPFVPGRWCWPWRCEVTAKVFLWRCKVMTLQFVVCKPLLAIMDYAFSRTGRFKGELLDYTKPAMYITILLNISVSLALASLLSFFHATQHHSRLEPHQPWPKFVAIKGVVFMTWFQGVAITLALKLQLGALADPNLAAAFQNFLVCVEMFVAALAHSHIFGADEWQPNYKPLRVAATVADNLALHDFVRDFRSVLPRVRRQQRERASARPVVEDPTKSIELAEMEKDHVDEDASLSSLSIHLDDQHGDREEKEAAETDNFGGYSEREEAGDSLLLDRDLPDEEGGIISQSSNDDDDDDDELSHRPRQKRTTLV